jgi:hypothetical protein
VPFVLIEIARSRQRSPRQRALISSSRNERDADSYEPVPAARYSLGQASVSRSGAKQCISYSPWLSGKVLACGWLGVAAASVWARRAPVPPSQAVSVAIQWLWSFSRLCVAATRRHSDNAAARPRRWNRLILPLNLICANTGSTVAFRCL